MKFSTEAFCRIYSTSSGLRFSIVYLENAERCVRRSCTTPHHTAIPYLIRNVNKHGQTFRIKTNLKGKISKE